MASAIKTQLLLLLRKVNISILLVGLILMSTMAGSAAISWWANNLSAKIHELHRLRKEQARYAKLYKVDYLNLAVDDLSKSLAESNAADADVIKPNNRSAFDEQARGLETSTNTVWMESKKKWIIDADRLRMKLTAWSGAPGAISQFERIVVGKRLLHQYLEQLQAERLSQKPQRKIDLSELAKKAVRQLESVKKEADILMATLELEMDEILMGPGPTR